MALTRLQQLSAVAEVVSGTATAPATLFAAANTSYLLREPSIEYTVPTFDRNILRGTLSPESPLTGIKLGTLRFSLEVTGNSTGAEPSWSRLLRACGFRYGSCGRISIGSVTNGPFLAGERITYGGGTDYRTLVKTVYDGEPYLWHTNTNDLGQGTAPANTGVFTGAVSGATATADDDNEPSSGHAWWPGSFPIEAAQGTATNLPDVGDLLSDDTSGGLAVVTTVIDSTPDVIYYRPVSGAMTTGAWTNITQSEVVWASSSLSGTQIALPTLSIGLVKDGVREYLYGSRGTVSFAGNIGEPMIMTFEFQGPIADPSDGGAVSGVSFPQLVPPTLLDAGFAVGDSSLAFASEAAPCVGSISVDMANELSQRLCMNTTDGLVSVEINGRAPTATFDPELLPSAFFDWVGNLKTNEPIRARWNLGSATNNTFRFEVANGLITAMGQGDRNGQITRTPTVTLSAKNPGTDNEFTILYDKTT